MSNATQNEISRLEAELEATHAAMNVAWAGGWVKFQNPALVRSTSDAYAAAHRAWWIATR